MNIARILYPVETLGPGKRIGIWTCGCPRRCDGCANPDLWEFDEKRNVKIEVLLDMIRQIIEKHPVDGFTISGGEPVSQGAELEKLLSALSVWSEDILVFTGYDIKEASNLISLEHVAVLVDGPYIKERNRGLILRGSDNQIIHILKSEFKSTYQKYLSEEHSKIQNFLDGYSVISVGIHRPDYVETICDYMEKKGLIERGAIHEPIYSEMA